MGQNPSGQKNFFRCKNCDYNVELEVEAVFEDGLCSNCLVKEGFQKEYGTHGKWMKNGEYAKKIKGATYEDYDAESFEADDDYVIVDRGNYRVRVHKKNLDRFNRSTMHKIHSERNKEGLMYAEETSRWIPLEAESFEAEYNLIGRRKPRKLSLKVSDLKEALENANDDADVFVGDINSCLGRNDWRTDCFSTERSMD